MTDLAVATTPKYVMRISRLTVDKLGVKLYDKVSAVIAELVANAYDADATEVVIRAPMGEYLATKAPDGIKDKGYTIEISDNGIGMTPEQVNGYYLRIGAERRNDPTRGDTSKTWKRKVMGRKGVGKLAPFGICQNIEVLTSGGELTDGYDEAGQAATGYLTAHLILDRSAILQDDDFDYPPTVGPFDGIVRPATGMTLRLSSFAYRRVPTIDDLARQLSQRFGIRSANWNVILRDSAKTDGDPDQSRGVGEFEVDVMTPTRLRFDVERDNDGEVKVPATYRVFSADGNIRADLEAGFHHDGRFYPVTGWVAYARDPYRDDLMAGVRIYCRGKIAAQTLVFNRKAGFTGEHSIRSYLTGELHADWLDEDEDLIQTDRRDILWSHEIAEAFQAWGQSVVLKLGTIARDPMKQVIWEAFKAVSRVEERIAEAFPTEGQEAIREQALELAKLVGKTMRGDEVNDPEQTDSIVQLSLTLAPHLTLDNKLREAADASLSPLALITSILRTARIAELSSFGRIADDRLKVIGKVESLKDDVETLEAALQALIQETPWLIDPQWSPITANQSFSTLRSEFQKYYKLKTGEDISLQPFEFGDKRADFVLSNQDGVIQIIEIKRPSHAFEDEEMIRLYRYVEQMRNFLAEDAHRDFTQLFRDFHVTLVCDSEKLSGVHKEALESLKRDGKLTHISWVAFLARTRRVHEEFLAEAERQRRDAAKT